MSIMFEVVSFKTDLFSLQESLLALHRNLKRQLDIINRQRRNNVGDDGWVVVPNQNHSHVP